MRAEIIATGSELLLGEQVDTNSPHIARKFREIGLDLIYTTIVGDDEPRMLDAIRIALTRADVILTSGGLGPTVDDVTRSAVARALGRELVFHEDLFKQIEARFRAYGRPMTDNNRQQAYLPDGAQAIENPVGTAPSFAVEHQGRLIISLPGVPRELTYLLDHAVIPLLKSKLQLQDVIVVRTLHTVGEGESRIDAAIADLERSTNPVIGLSAKAGQVDVRLSAKASRREEAQALLAAMEARVRERIGAFIFGADEETLEGVILSRLADRHHTLATVELNTGGSISSRLTRRTSSGPSSNDAFRGGLVLSDANALRKALDVDVTPAEHLAVVTRAAQRIRAVHAATLGLAVMLREASDGPGFTVYVALVSAGGAETLERSYGGHADLSAQWTAALALGLVWKQLK
jgi:competence/damage-inducible protein CinA-like protein